MNPIHLLQNHLQELPLHYWLHRVIDIPIFKEWIKTKRKSQILQIGCGKGYEARYLAETLPCAKYLAIDNEAQAIARAESLAGSNSNIVFQTADYNHLPFPDKSFDVVFSFDKFHHLSNWKNVLQEIHRVLKPEGQLALKTYSIETYNLPLLGLVTQRLFANPYDTMFDQTEFLTYLRKNGFSITHQNDSQWMLILVANKKELPK